MKKQYLFFAVLFISGASVATAQQITAPQTAKFTTTNENQSKAAIDLRAMKAFHGKFPANQNEQWAKTGTGYLVNFDLQNIRYTVFLNSKGTVTSQIRYYSENELPLAIRNLIQTNYSCFSIKSVKEIASKNATACLVTIANGNAWKVIRVVGEETDVFEDHQ